MRKLQRPPAYQEQLVSDNGVIYIGGPLVGKLITELYSDCAVGELTIFSGSNLSHLTILRLI